MPNNTKSLAKKTFWSTVWTVADGSGLGNPAQLVTHEVKTGIVTHSQQLKQKKSLAASASALKGVFGK